MNSDQVSGKFDQIKGKVKQGVGEAVGDQRLANQGVADQVKGAAKEVWGNAKDAVHQSAEASRVESHERADYARANVVDNVAAARTRERRDRRPQVARATSNPFRESGHGLPNDEDVLLAIPAKRTAPNS